ncbi:rCG37054 [Rattus norvegicus]|uniref:RCG37054 n=1 Tax=Rattus norvegicus TaxID=10116 RepID=A6HTX3_RAT|nr:rCG37054 [Rattus norvegicus]
MFSSLLLAGSHYLGGDHQYRHTE